MDGGDKNTFWVIANWKSNKTILDALDWISQVGPQIPKNDKLRVVLCPTFSILSEAKKAITVGNFPIILGSQDISPYGIGAYTGEEPASLLNQLVEIAIIGHSERKKYFNETDEMVIKKVEQALANKIVPLVCVQDENTAVPAGCEMIAYEPIWAISTGLTNTPGVGKVDNPESANNIASLFKQKYSPNLKVIYGGSVDSGNVKGFCMQENISGVLVGNASLNAMEFTKICQVILENV